MFPLKKKPLMVNTNCLNLDSPGKWSPGQASEELP